MTNVVWCVCVNNFQMNDYHIRFLQSFRHKADYEEMDLTELDEETVIDKFEEVNMNVIFCQLLALTAKSHPKALQFGNVECRSN